VTISPEQTVRFALRAGTATLLIDHGTPDGSQQVQTANGRVEILFGDVGPEGATVGLTCDGLPDAEWRVSSSVDQGD
jgi:hypothetical protein